MVRQRYQIIFTNMRNVHVLALTISSINRFIMTPFTPKLMLTRQNSLYSSPMPTATSPVSIQLMFNDLHQQVFVIFVLSSMFLFLLNSILFMYASHVLLSYDRFIVYRYILFSPYLLWYPLQTLLFSHAFTIVILSFRFAQQHELPTATRAKLLSSSFKMRAQEITYFCCHQRSWLLSESKL